MRRDRWLTDGKLVCTEYCLTLLCRAGDSQKRMNRIEALVDRGLEQCVRQMLKDNKADLKGVSIRIDGKLLR